MINSEQIFVTSGVPQGDHLSPVLFNLFINYISHIIFLSKILLLADDAKIVENIRCLPDAVELQLDLNNVYKWCQQNALHLNLKKCSYITFSLKKQPIKCNYSLGNISLLRVSTVHDLGVIFDSKLSLKDHILFIRNKASAKLGFLKRTCQHFRDEHALKKIILLINPFTF